MVSVEPPPVSHAHSREPSVHIPSAPKGADDPIQPTVKLGFLSDRRVPPWLLSTIVHAGALIALALLRISNQQEKLHEIQLSFADQRAPEILTEVRPLVSPELEPLTHQQAADLSPRRAMQVAIPMAHIEARQTSDSTSPDSDKATHALAHNSTSAIDAAASIYLPSGGGIEGRAHGTRQLEATDRGASPQSEQAVELALSWLVEHQNNDGSWDFDLSKQPCNGRCKNHRNNPDGQPTPKTAATGLALLPFLGAGYAHKGGPHAQVISRGLYYLRGQMRETSNGRELMHGSMYGHGIATLAIAEAHAMTGDEDLVEPLRDLIMFTTVAQHSAGGWRYKPGQPGDMTVTGWQVLSLKSCQLGGLSIPTDVMPRAKRFVQSLSSEKNSRFGYLESKPQPTSTAVGLLLSMYLGAPRGDASVLNGCQYLCKLGPSKTNVYYNYYATMALHHAQHEGFAVWNTTLRDYLVSNQADEGHEAGSWGFRDRFGDTGGRLYTTAMCALVLETYYRYLPLWKAAEFPL